MAQAPVAMALCSAHHCPARPNSTPRSPSAFSTSASAVVSWTKRRFCPCDHQRSYRNGSTARCSPALSKSVSLAVTSTVEGDAKVAIESQVSGFFGPTGGDVERLSIGLPIRIPQLAEEFGDTREMSRDSVNLAPETMQELGPLDTHGLYSGGARKGRSRGATSTACDCRVCGRRGLVASLGACLAASGMTVSPALAFNFETSDYNAVREAMHPARPIWYQELYAQALARTMASYEAEVADYKHQLFQCLDEKVENVLELGIGTGPNLKYYGRLPHLQKVVGVDPNIQMARYCRESASSAGLTSSQFEFLNAVGEGIPVREESMDAVVCTLTLCSVTDVTLTLEEVKRVLRPGGAFLFVEHVAAPDGSALRFWQALFEPLQQWVADNCHLQRSTLKYIESHFDTLQSERFTVKSASLMGPHIMGVAYK